MADRIIHRGPDGSGVWSSDAHGIALAHRRLAILDLSEAGRQPMVSSSGRFVVTFNGEIYNFSVLKKQLQSLGHCFRGGSDTEVMLAAFEQWGVRPALDHFVGMFAFAVWDSQQRRLHLARDRLGKKPLYYGWVGKTLLFASELKALHAFPGFRGEIDRTALGAFFRHNYIPSPLSIYRSIRKLRPGTVITLASPSEQGPVREEQYWSAENIAAAGAARRFVGSFDDAVAAFRVLLQDAVSIRMVSDVPLGAFLSGGIDSSLVVAMMAESSSLPVKTFTIGFREDAYNEARFAKEVAAHIGTDHTELYVSPEQALEVVPRLANMYDEPFADSSQIPTFLVSHFARKNVTVALSGDGGDELACGYNRYLWFRSVWRLVRILPAPSRRMLARSLANRGGHWWVRAIRMLGPVAPASLRSNHLSDRLRKVADLFEADSAQGIYRQLLSHWSRPHELVLGLDQPIPDIAATVRGSSTAEMIESIMTLDTANYLPDDVLVKVDRASMACSLEARAPLLDHRLFELSRTMPLNYHLRGSRGKMILRAILRAKVPETLTERPKAGFGVPIDSWLRGPLRSWAEDLLNETRLRRDGYLNANMVRSVWEDHLTGARNAQYLVWDVLMFQSWLDKYRQTTIGPA